MGSGINHLPLKRVGVTHQFECSPNGPGLGDLEQHKLRRPERVDVLQRYSGDNRRDEAAPHHVAVVEERVELLETEQHAAQGASECY